MSSQGKVAIKVVDSIAICMGGCEYHIPELDTYPPEWDICPYCGEHCYTSRRNIVCVSPENICLFKKGKRETHAICHYQY